jgi:DNA end-binding protein Ku
LRQTKKVGLGQLSVRGREQLVSLKPCGRGLVMEVLRYADEVQKAQGYFRDVGDKAPDPELLDLAATLIDKKTAPFDPGEFHDRYVDALHKLIDKKAKAKGKRILEDVEEPGRPSGANVIDLMAALKSSVSGGGASSSKKPAVRSKEKAAPKMPPRAPAKPRKRA